MNIETGEIKPWDSLTDEQQKSGEWIKLPTHDENGVALAQRDPGHAIRQLFGKPSDADIRDLTRARATRFDALGKPVR